MPNIPIPQINFGKRKEASQMSFVFTTDGRGLTEEIPVISNCAISDKHTSLFMIEQTEQYEGKDGNFYQLFSDKSQIPLMPKSEDPKRLEIEKRLEGMADDIFDLTEDIKAYENFMANKKNDRGDVIKWCVSIVMAAFVIIAGMQYLWG